MAQRICNGCERMKIVAELEVKGHMLFFCFDTACQARMREIGKQLEDKELLHTGVLCNYEFDTGGFCGDKATKDGRCVHHQADESDHFTDISHDKPFEVHNLQAHKSALA